MGKQKTHLQKRKQDMPYDSAMSGCYGLRWHSANTTAPASPSVWAMVTTVRRLALGLVYMPFGKSRGVLLFAEASS